MIVTASVVVVLDHGIRGIYWPRSVYGVLTVSPWRWVEHAGWVVFEDVFLIRACVQTLRELRRTSPCTGQRSRTAGDQTERTV